jgi:hypothetical protein
MKALKNSSSTLTPFLLLLACFFAVSPRSFAEHGGPNASSVAGLADHYLERLDEIADDFGFEPGDQPNFDEARFNRLVGKARIALDRGIGLIERGRVCAGMSQLTRCTSLLGHATDFAIEQNMSGSGYSDDLASFLSGVTEFFLEDLLAIAPYEGGIPSWIVDWARVAYERGKALRKVNVDEWSASMRAFSLGTCLIFRSL